jgi:hypothetical protein
MGRASSFPSRETLKKISDNAFISAIPNETRPVYRESVR